MPSTTETHTLLSELETAARTVAERAGASTVSIGRHGRGSGVVIGADRILTNAHNLRDRTTQVTLGDGTVTQARVVGVDTHADLVVLEATTGDTPAIDWASETAVGGSVVFAVARSPRGSRVSFGLVSGADRVSRGPGGRRISQSLEHTAPMARGSSGGPLVDSDGRLVGVNTHRIGDGFYLAQAATAELHKRVDALSEGRSPRTLRLGIAIAPGHVARKLRAAVGLPERDGLLIRGVEADGPAAGAGIAEGDLLVSAAGRALANADDLFDVLAAHDEAAPLEIGVVRGAEELTMSATFDHPADEPQHQSED